MTIIPANPGFELLCCSIECGKAELYAPRPIVAWRVTEHGPIPIAVYISFSGKEMTWEDYIGETTPDGVMPSLRYAVRHGGTVYDACVGGEFDSEGGWREWLQGVAEARWRRMEAADDA